MSLGRASFSKGVFSLVVFGLAGALIYVGYRYKILRDEFGEDRARLNESIEQLQSAGARKDEEIFKLKELNASLEGIIEEEKQRNAQFAQRVEEITGVVQTLEKLRKLDEELLQKYSKVYFLNEHYRPDSLSKIPPWYLSDPDRDQEIHTNVLPYLEKMMTLAKEDGVDMQIVSGYRSFETQAGLKSGYSVVYGSGANKFSADQGYSEHQLGTALDFTSKKEIGGALTGFEKTKAYVWLKNKAHRFGFVLSYPENNQYYIFEPWHWRFVGVELATKLYDEGKNFYDEDQEAINEFLLKIFD